MKLLLLLFILVPAAELVLLIEVGSRIGVLSTFALIVLTGILGASLARHQGLSLLHRLRMETQTGRLPGDTLIDGLIILVAGAFLLTPGFLTDTVGFLCLVPGVRRAIKRRALRWFERKAQRSEFHVAMCYSDAGAPRGEGPVYDVTPEEDRSPRS